MKSNELKRKRLEINLTQETLANSLGKSRKTINSYENGAIIPENVQIALKLFFENLKYDKVNILENKSQINKIDKDDLKFLIEPVLESHQKTEKMIQRTNIKIEGLNHKINELGNKIDLLIDITQKASAKTSDDD